MACDFTRYNELRDITRNKAAGAQASCAAVETAQDGLVNAQDAYDAAVTAKDAAYAEWESAEQAENQEAFNLGIKPIGPVPQQLPSQLTR